jgi:hypothetical protein
MRVTADVPVMKSHDGTGLLVRLYFLYEQTGVFGHPLPRSGGRGAPLSEAADRPRIQEWEAPRRLNHSEEFAMQSHPSALSLGGVACSVVIALLAVAAAALLAACGGDDGTAHHDATTVSVLDIDALGSVDAAAADAAAARGAPGEAEPVVYVVRAARADHAARAAAELVRLGFERVRIAEARDGPH